MTIELVDTGWGEKIIDGLRNDASELRVICPFIKLSAVEQLLQLHPRKIEVITRFNLADFAAGASDIAALQKLLEAGASVRGIKNLHAKLYLFGTSRAVITSANLTQKAFYRNHEFGLVTEDASLIKTCRDYFNDLWKCGEENLTSEQLVDWDERVAPHRQSIAQSSQAVGLDDFGKVAGQGATPNTGGITMRSTGALSIDADNQQFFVKFLGKREKGGSKPLSYPVINVVEDGECHWAVTYPSSRRPRQPQDGDTIFIARLTTEDPRGIRIFGCATAMKHVEGRDEATDEDIARHDWKRRYSQYIRVYDAEFINGTLENGISLYEMMRELQSDSFATTQNNARKGEGNTDPRRAYFSKPDVRLSKDGFEWLREKLLIAFKMHGKIPQAEIDKLYFPPDQPPPPK